MLEMYVAGVGLESKSGQPIILLDDFAKQHILPIWISPAEFIVVSNAMDNLHSARPMTHDLLLNIINQLGYTVKQIELNEVMAESCRATIQLSTKGPEQDDVMSLDARPSDAIAVALKAKVPIFVSSKLVAEAIIEVDGNHNEIPEDDGEFKDFLETLKASDFDKYS